MPTTTLNDISVWKTLRVRKKTLLFFDVTWTEGKKILAFAKARDRIAVIVERIAEDESRWIDGYLIWGNAAKLLKANDMLGSYGVPSISIDYKRLEGSITRWNHDQELLEKAGKLVQDDGTLIPTAFPREWELGEETTAIVSMWEDELLGLLWQSQTDEPEAVLELALSITLAHDERGEDEIMYQTPRTDRQALAILYMPVVGCIAFAPILVYVFGPWGGIIGSVLSAFAWFGLSQFGGLLGGILTMLVLGVNMTVFFLSSVALRGLPGA